MGGFRSAKTLRYAIVHPPAEPVVPGSRLAGYAGRALPKKFDIKAGSVVALVDAPPGFERTLRELPDGVELRNHARGPCDVVIWFTKSRKDLESRIEQMVPLADDYGLWIAWPKKISGTLTDVSQVTVRKVALAAGIVDYKICAVGATWSGLGLTTRKTR